MRQFTLKFDAGCQRKDDQGMYSTTELLLILLILLVFSRIYRK